MYVYRFALAIKRLTKVSPNSLRQSRYLRSSHPKIPAKSCTYREQRKSRLSLMLSERIMLHKQ